MDKMEVSYSTILGLFAEMVLDEALRQFHERRLYEQIDHALAVGDETTFYALTKELKHLQSN